MNIYLFLIIILTLILISIVIMWSKSKNSFEFQIEDVVLSTDELERHAEHLAKSQQTTKDRYTVKKITKRLETKYQDILPAYLKFNTDVSAGFPIPPSAEWLLDNFYIIEEQKNVIIRELNDIRRPLPVITEGIYAGFPRIYTIAIEIVSHIDGNAGEKVIHDFIAAYQRYTFLSIEELWMLTLMIKAALMEKLWVVCEQMKKTNWDWHKADQIVNYVTENNQNCDDFRKQINELDELTPAFVEYLIKKLRKKGSKTLWMIECIDSILIQKSSTTDSFISIDHLNQAVCQVSIGNVINSFRTLSGYDNVALFESLSEVERILKQDPSGIYTKMDFKSRNHYRNVIIKLARKYKTTEINIARLSNKFAKKSSDLNNELSPDNHVGYYLVGKGKKQILAELDRKVNPSAETQAGGKGKYVKLYISLIILLSIIITLIPIKYSLTGRLKASTLFVIIAGLFCLIPASEIVIAVINSCISRFVKPARFPRLELKEGIPEELATMVIVPTLVPNTKRALSLIDSLEIFYLANKGENIYFSLVGDFKDANEEILSEDSNVIEAALKKIEELNQKYASKEKPIFYFFCRKRQFNQKQNKWMGWERKRGAIIEFNRMLRGDNGTSYIYHSSETVNLPHIKYVITLDADTELPLETAKQLVGTIAHPLNKAVFNDEKGTVTEGYGLLQPRIDVNIVSANASIFTKVFAGQGGIDPYTTAVSDVYQDAFGEAVFTGKGIYDVDIFQKALNDTIPENTVLSHDLLEGSYLRTGLVSDIELIDGYPAKYNSFMMRLHRWTRGDWQLLKWIFGRSPLSVLSKWKMFDNLRRSLIYPAMVIIIILSLSALKNSSIAWILITVLALCSPVLSYFVQLIFAGDYRIYISKRSVTIFTGFKSLFMQLFLILAFAPYQAYLMLNAIIKTLARVLVTKKNMLEWVTAADMELALKSDLMSYYRRMWFSPVFGTAILLLCAYSRTDYIWWSIVTFVLWLLSPWIAYYISKPYDGSGKVLSGDNLHELRLLARKTWCYFDEYAGQDNNYLPADNYQVEPYKGAAERTSPTNIGLLLVSNLAARDMGYINTLDMLERTENTIATVEKMEKWNGHLFNWYNTANLHVLRPKFVSTVDSGNFAGYLMVLIEGLAQYSTRPIYDENSIDGLFDLLELCNEEINKDKPYFDIAKLKDLTYERNSQNNAFQGGESNQRVKDNQKKNAAGTFDRLVSAISKTLNEFLNSSRAGYWVGKLVKDVNRYQSDFEKYADGLFNSLDQIQEIRTKAESLIKRIQQLVDNMKFKGLFDEDRNLFSIGFNVEEGHIIKSYYDLFASEARQTSLIAIAKGEVNKQHWFKLGRKLVNVGGNKGLASWTGTMFEYLMPRLLIKSYPNTLTDRTYDFAVKTQIKYGLSNHIPWGISESCYYAFDIALNYQYRAFGVPYLGLKRGLINDAVVAPYATIMAIDIATDECIENIKRLKQLGAEGQFGLYEAVDFTKSRLSDNQSCAIVKSYMVHHQGMSMLALVNFFKDSVMQTRFHNNPQIKAVDALIQEKFPDNVIVSKKYTEQPLYEHRKEVNTDEIVLREYGEPEAIPKMHLLTNGNYNVALTDKGSGYGKCNSMSVYRWVNDYMQSSGAFIYIRNVNSNEYWSATYSPVNTKPEAYKVIYSPHKAEYVRREGNIETNTEVIISAEDNTEIRRVSIHNHSDKARVIELTSYMEVVLIQPEADSAHPAFSKLFIKTEYIDEYNGLLAMRRKRDDVKQTVWGYHAVSTNKKIHGKVEYETDRSQFIGRNRNLASPRVMEPDQPLSNSVGSVLDPVFSLRIRVSVDAGDSAIVNFCIGSCDTRKIAVEMLEKYSVYTAAERVIEMAWTRSIVEAGFINISARDEMAYLKLLPELIYGIDRKEQAGYIVKNTLSQSELWTFGISGDVPIVLVTIHSRDSFEEIQWALKLHDYFRLKGVIFDLVILITNEESYIQPIYEMIRDMAVSGRSYEHLDKRGGIFIRNVRQMNSEQKNLLFTCAKIIIDADKGIGDFLDSDFDGNNQELQYVRNNNVQIQNALIQNAQIQNIHADVNNDSNDVKKVCSIPQNNMDIQRELFQVIESLKFFNGIGGFANDGNEYVICLRPGKNTPAPWVNIIANDKFGFICTESGGGYTWYQNSSQNKLSTWANDPVQDTPSEIIYLHDPDSGAVWNAAPSPVRESEPYIIRHGFGYTSFRHDSHGLEQELTEFAAADMPVKINVLKLKNISDSQKTIDAAYYLRPVLGVEISQTAPYIVTSFDAGLSTVFIDNVYSSDFRGLTAFISCSEQNITYTGQRLDFIGRDMDITQPGGMKTDLKGTVGAGLDACAVVKTRLNIPPGETKEVVFLFGQEKAETLQTIIPKFRDLGYADEELNRVKEGWNKRLNHIQINTPDLSMNILLNGWLQYQVLSSRIWARTGFYQAGGAFGFRDQLQDVMSIVYVLPELTKKQILLHCRHQFIEGDVQHWWHDQKMNGIRTRYSDDLLWLPYVTCDYINATGDYDILNISEKYLQSELLRDDEHERYEIPKVADMSGSVYEHCIRAIDKGLRFGAHGIPLMGGGDWNDGMNLIGVNGNGESVWLGWFLYCVLQKIIPVCRHIGDNERADSYQTSADKIIEAIEKEAWDGSWYRRAYFDDGTPLGSIQNDEGKIDSLSQSWAAISTAAKNSRVEEAMDAVEKYLIDRKNGLIKLLTPPFYDSELNPGYIKGYLPGVRENGGQYTHAATWVIYAFSKLGNGEKAWELFNMINPINHARTDMESMTYKVEPYVLAADVYAVYPNEGRGGWTWYTGAAGWMYRIGIEHILGIKKQGKFLIIDPCIPRKLSEYSVRYVYGTSVYNISVKNHCTENKAVKQIKIDDKIFETNRIELVDDGRTHDVEAYM
jgi:cellobiose phosphorylase